jgi:hypothetical protein
MQCLNGLLRGVVVLQSWWNSERGRNGTKKGAVQKEGRLVYGMNPLAGGVRNPPQHQATVVAVVDRGSAVTPSAPDLVDKEPGRENGKKTATFVDRRAKDAQDQPKMPAECSGSVGRMSWCKAMGGEGNRR